MRPLKIISGGQTGVDQAALRAAFSLGLPTGGWAPQNWRTDDGPNLALRDIYKLRPANSLAYPYRTRKNIEDSDATLIVAINHQEPGCTLTRNVCGEISKPVLSFALTDQLELLDPTGRDVDLRITTFLRANNVRVLNCAGNREKTYPGIGARAEELFKRVFSAYVNPR